MKLCIVDLIGFWEKTPYGGRNGYPPLWTIERMYVTAELGKTDTKGFVQYYRFVITDNAVQKTATANV
jgi:hypothetical protein